MLELFYHHKEEFHKGGFCIFRIFIFCRKLSNQFSRYIKIVASITNFILSSLISDNYVIQRGSISYQTWPPPPPEDPCQPTPGPPPPPGRVLCTFLVTIPRAGPSLNRIPFHRQLSMEKSLYIHVC